MKYYMFRLSFPYGVHFGDGNLDSSNMTFHADTLFSALFIEAVKSGEQVAQQLLENTKKGNVVLSDAFPYIGDTYYLPKPLVYIQRNEDVGNSVLKKKAKKLNYVPVDKMEEYLQGELDIKKEGDKFACLGSGQVKASVAIKGLEDTEPYYVGTYSYAEDNGLYFFAGLEEEFEDAFLDLLDMLSFSGIGGKRSSGYGRFEVMKMVPVPKERFATTSSDKGYMLLSASLPKAEEMAQALENAEYLVEKRSGFVQSQSFLAARKKSEQYFLKAGSRFMHPFEGDIYEVSVGGEHPVYRYGKAMFWAL